MRIRTLWTLGLFVAVAALLAVPAFPEDEAPGAPGGADPNEWWQKVATPGEHHRWMDFTVGSWTTESSFWQGPGEPVTSAGKVETRWALGRHYLQSEYKGEMMGMPFEGELTLAYDNATERYQQVWIDNMSTGLLISMGTREGDVVTFTGEAVTHMGTLPKRDVLTKISADEYTLETYWAIPGVGDFKVMEIHYKRTP